MQCYEKKSEAVMVNNSMNINKTNKQPTLALNNWTQQHIITYDVGNPGPGVEQVQQMWRGSTC
jgi:hypothetical protein